MTKAKPVPVPEAAFGSVRPADAPRPQGLESFSTVDLSAELVHRARVDLAAKTIPSDAEISLGVLLRRVLDSRLDVHENRWSRQHFFNMIAGCVRSIESVPVPLHGSTYVDLGCGAANPFGLLFLLLMLGARRGIAIDAEALTDRAGAAQSLAELAARVVIDPAGIFGDQAVTRGEILANLEGFDLARLGAGDMAGIPRRRLEYVRASADTLPLADAVADVVLTCAFFEHVERLEHTVAELARITAPGGVGVHIIDGRDHRSFTDPAIHALDFLRIDDAASIVHHCNRVRPVAFAPIFERHGFTVKEVTAVERAEITPELRASFAERYRSLPANELATTVVRLVVQRRPEGARQPLPLTQRVRQLLPRGWWRGALRR